MEEAPEVSAVAAAIAALAHHESLPSEQRMEAEKVVLLAFRYFDKTCELGGGCRKDLQAACAHPCRLGAGKAAQVTAELLLCCCMGSKRPCCCYDTLGTRCGHVEPVGAAL